MQSQINASTIYKKAQRAYLITKQFDFKGFHNEHGHFLLQFNFIYTYMNMSTRFL